MSFLKTIKPEEAEGPVAEIYKPFQEALGLVPAPLQLFSASPGLLSAMGPVREYYMNHPTLSQGLMALIRLLVAEDLQYNYCISFNRNILKMMGIRDDDQLAEVMADPRQAPLEEKDKAMLEVTLKACTKPEMVEEGDIQRLRDLGWQDADILDAMGHGLMMVQSGMLEKEAEDPEEPGQREDDPAQARGQEHPPVDQGEVPHGEEAEDQTEVHDLDHRPVDHVQRGQRLRPVKDPGEEKVEDPPAQMEEPADGNNGSHDAPPRSSLVRPSSSSQVLGSTATL